ncbi:unnamed protein product [Gongylonema pulchrum]|uniref:Transmembrane protein n=1 Tax=Gongylonema pulchrum TaxID=637853 RepID=A0A183CVL6_9BILA|nr:unnamed protein product [Gongylonema pulchrum]
MSGEVFFEFNVKPGKKRKTPSESDDNKQMQNGVEQLPVRTRSERKKHRRKLDENVWKRTDYATASVERYTTEKPETEDIELTSEENSQSGEDPAERKTRKKRKKKGPPEGVTEIHHWDVKPIKKTRVFPSVQPPVPPRHPKGESATPEDDREDTIELDEAPIEEATMEPDTKTANLEDTTKTARCKGSMESDMPNEEQQPVNFETVYGPPQISSSETTPDVELRYWGVLALFIFLIIIYRSFLPPVQCDTAFTQ